MFSKFTHHALSLLLLPLSLFACNVMPPTNPRPTMAEMTATTSPTPTIFLFTETPIPPTATVEPTKMPAPIGVFLGDTATFLEENYPDGSIVKPGESFIKTWKIKNTGVVTWNTAYTLALSTAIPGDVLGSPQKIGIPQSVAPGETLSLSIALTAPNAPGTYTVYWSVQNESAQIVKVDGM